MHKAEFISIRIAELSAQRAACAQLVMNKSMPVLIRQLDAQIGALEALNNTYEHIVDVKQPVLISQSPEMQTIVDCECEHCGFSAKIMCNKDDATELDWCPKCGTDARHVTDSA